MADAANVVATKPITFTDANFQSEVLESDQLVLIDFWATWCGPCRMIAPVIDELAADFEGRVKIGKLDVDTNQQVSSAYNVRSIPTLLFIKDGVVVDQIVGAPSKRALEQRIENLLTA